MANSRATRNFTTSQDDFTTTFTTTSTSLVDVTGFTLTAPSAGEGLIIVLLQLGNGDAGTGNETTVKIISADQYLTKHAQAIATYQTTTTSIYPISCAGQAIIVRAKVTSGTLSVYGSTAATPSQILLLT